MLPPGYGIDDPPYVSTGELPRRELVQQLVGEAHERYRDDRSGEVSAVYPVLAEVPDNLFGICVVDTHAGMHLAGDCDYEFALMSVAKPFVFALICQLIGPDRASERIGVDSTGLPFNSLAAIERSPDGRTNPMVNAGAIATTSLVPGDSLEHRWRWIQDGVSRFAGHPLALDDAVYASASQTNARNHGIARLLESCGRLYSDPAQAVDLYTRQSSLRVTARDLALMGATLAAGGVNPMTGERVIAPNICHYTLAVMLTAGMYETSGSWLYDVGLPAKSGIGGGILTVSPGKGGMGTFAPPLDRAGNSVKGQSATRFLSSRLGLDLLISRPPA